MKSKHPKLLICALIGLSLILFTSIQAEKTQADKPKKPTRRKTDKKLADEAYSLITQGLARDALRDKELAVKASPLSQKKWYDDCL